MADRFNKSIGGLSGPAQDGFAITSANNTVFAQPTRSVYVGSTGNLTVSMVGYDSNNALTFANVPAGTMLPIRIDQVFTDSTANNILGLY